MKWIRSSKIGIHCSVSASVSCRARHPFDKSKYGPQAELALDMVKHAAHLCTTFDDESASLDKVVKDDQSPVTIADYAIQSMVSDCIERSPFMYPLIAEEDMQDMTLGFEEELCHLVDTFQPSASGVATMPQCDADAIEDTYWVLDPIDGTRGFVSQKDCDQFAIGLALVQSGTPVVGILGLPNWHRSSFGSKHNISSDTSGIILASVIGCGTWMYQGSDYSDPVQVNTDTSEALEDATFLISKHQEWDQLPTGKAYAPRCPALIKKGCCGSLAKYAAVATGSVSAYVEHPMVGKDKVKVWDHAAGVICVTEAGGSVTDLSGQSLNIGRQDYFYPEGCGIVVSNGDIHQEIVRKAQAGIEIWGRTE